MAEGYNIKVRRLVRFAIAVILSVGPGPAHLKCQSTVPPHKANKTKELGHQEKANLPPAPSPNVAPINTAVVEQDLHGSKKELEAKPVHGGFTLSDRIALWTMIVAAITAVATIGQAFVTYLIARSISKASGLSESLQISREIDKIWQDYNRQAIVNEDFRNTIRQLESLSEDTETTKLRHLIFYLLNIIYISWTAQTSKRDNFEHSQTIVKDHLAVLYAKKELVLSILNGHRGYNQTFVRACVQAFSQMDNDHAVANADPGASRSFDSDQSPPLASETVPSSAIGNSCTATIGEAAMDKPNPSEVEVDLLNSQEHSLLISDTPTGSQVPPDAIKTLDKPADAKPQVITRLARQDEWKAIQTLNLQIFEFELEHCEPTSNLDFPFTAQGEEYFQKAAQQQEPFSAIVAELAGVVVGYAIIKKIAPVDLNHRVGVVQYQLSTLSVDKNHRNQGIGGELVDAAKAFAMGQGANRLKVTAYAGNDRAEHLYKKKGFSELETTYEVKL